MTTIKNILTYVGNKNYFCCFCQDEDDKYFVLFTRITGVNIESSYDDNFSFTDVSKIINPITEHKITLPLLNHYYVISINDFKDFELINKVLEAVWTDD